MRRAYQFGSNSGRNEDRRQSNHPYCTSEVWNDCGYGDRRRLSHNRFDFRDKSKFGDCGQFNREVESKGARGQSFSGRKSNHKFDFRSRNSRNCSQFPKNRRGW